MVLPQRFLGKVAVVTASTDGIGFAIAKRLAGEGAAVMISSRKQKNVENAIKELKSANLKVAGMTCHVGSETDRVNLFKETARIFGGVDILVSNAAVNPAVGAVLDCPSDVWDKIFDINVKSAYLLAKEAVPYMRERKQGNIIFISSIAGFTPIGALGAYSVSKTALFGLTKAASGDLIADKIRVNCIAPGIIKTKFSSAISGNDDLLSMIPAGRFGNPEEIAGVAAFLASDDASYITGEVITAAGGMTSRL